MPKGSRSTTNRVPCWCTKCNGALVHRTTVHRHGGHTESPQHTAGNVPSFADYLGQRGGTGSTPGPSASGDDSMEIDSNLSDEGMVQDEPTGVPGINNPETQDDRLDDAAEQQTEDRRWKRQAEMENEPHRKAEEQQQAELESLLRKREEQEQRRREEDERRQREEEIQRTREEEMRRRTDEEERSQQEAQRRHEEERQKIEEGRRQHHEQRRREEEENRRREDRETQQYAMEREEVRRLEELRQQEEDRIRMQQEQEEDEERQREVHCLAEEAERDHFHRQRALEHDLEEQRRLAELQGGGGPGEGEDELLGGADYLDPDQEAAEALSDQGISRLEHIKISQEFLRLIQAATLEGDNLEPEMVERLRNPQERVENIDDPDVMFSLKLYMGLSQHPQSAYESAREATLERHPSMKVLSTYSVRKLLEELSGVVAVGDDMCEDGCHAFTGPWKDLDACTICGKARHNPDGTKPQQAITMPLGFQLQALRRSPEGSVGMLYRHEKLAQLLEEEDDDGNLHVYDDIFSGSDLRDLAREHRMTAHDTTVGYSIDGARLYQNKQSDTWIAIWIIYDYHPTTRYKHHHILPAVIIPGPNHPKHLDSYMLRSFYHLSALQRENGGRGLKMWDHQERNYVHSRLFFILGTADAMGLTDVDGRAGHHAAHGCRIGCPMQGRHKQSSGHYYAAHLRPNEQSTGCNHDDFDFETLTTYNIDSTTGEDITVKTYHENLKKIIESSNQIEFEARRKTTGLVKPSIILGLHPARVLPVPKCFTVDLMHLLYLNVSQLLIPIWRGTMKCEKTDNKANWDWAVLVEDVWVQHGEQVAEATKYFPASFHHPPRNPALKISSGFKATEYYLYVMGLGPGHFRALLPEKYWKNFCKLVHGVRIMLQRSITATQFQEAHGFFQDFVLEYEHLYYQRRLDRLHFCRPCLHTLLHTPSEGIRLGPGTYSTQFPIERTIGNLGAELRQPSTPFSNLAHIATRRAQTNAMKALYPRNFLTKADLNTLPDTAQDVGDGYVFLRPRSFAQKDWDKIDERVKVRIAEDMGMNRVTPYGRLLLPNGQVARSLFSEDRASRKHNRITRNVKLVLGDAIEYGEVQFFFFTTNDVPKAAISLYGEPDHDILVDSSNTLWATEFKRYADLRIVDMADIISVVSMQPLPKKELDEPQRWFVIEKSGLEDVELTGFAEVIPLGEND